MSTKGIKKGPRFSLDEKVTFLRKTFGGKKTIDSKTLFDAVSPKGSYYLFQHWMLQLRKAGIKLIGNRAEKVEGSPTTRGYVTYSWTERPAIAKKAKKTSKVKKKKTQKTVAESNVTSVDSATSNAMISEGGIA